MAVPPTPPPLTLMPGCHPVQHDNTAYVREKEADKPVWVWSAGTSSSRHVQGNRKLKQTVTHTIGKPKSHVSIHMEGAPIALTTQVPATAKDEHNN